MDEVVGKCRRPEAQTLAGPFIQVRKRTRSREELMIAGRDADMVNRST